jgi:methyl-accepting chemotaxis protein
MPSQLTIGRKITGGFALSLLALIVVGSVSFHSVNVLIDASNSVSQANQVQRSLADLASHMKDAETGQRGFVITGDEAYLEPYTNALTELPKDVAALSTLFSGDTAATTALGQAQTLIDDKLKELASTIATRKSAGFEETKKIVTNNTGKTYMDQLRQILGSLDAVQSRLLQNKAIEVRSAATSAITTVILGTVLGVVFVAIAGFLIVSSLNRQIGSAVGDMESSSTELQAAAQQQATGAKEQATAMSEIATTISELLATSRQISDSARQVAEIADKTAVSTRLGDATVQKARDSVGGIQRQVDLIVTHMLDLGKKSQQIGSVLDLINELAEQTNILAINATIEAAGAGDSGRRFAVVADEIRKLADRVAGSTKEIRLLIDEVRSAVNTTVMVTEAGSKAVDTGFQQVGDATASFTSIAGLVETTTAAAQEIGLSTKQQTSAIEQVNLAIANVSQTARESETSTTQTLQTASQLSGLSRDLSRLIHA